MIRFERLSQKQLRLVNWWKPGSPYESYDLVIADGAIRSGKTVAMICGFLEWSQKTFSHQSFILAGKTVGTLKRNVLKPMFAILDEWGWAYEYNRSEGVISIGTNTYHIFGASSDAAQDTLQGMTAAGALGDEVALFPQSFTDQMIGRCSLDGARIWMNCNPEGPKHWFKVEFIDKAEEKLALYLTFNMNDNPSLSAKVKARFERMFSGVFYKRYILGLWVRAEGVIFDMFDECKHVVDASELAFTNQWWVSVDYGTQNPCVFLLWGKTTDGKWVCTKEWYYDGRSLGKQMTDEEYADALEKFVGDHPIRSVTPDPSAASFIVTLRKRGKFHVRRGKNAVAPGIRNTATALSTGMLLFDKSCVETIKEFHAYVWDEKAVERGQDVPLKQSDHCMDAVRYFVHTVMTEGVSVLK